MSNPQFTRDPDHAYYALVEDQASAHVAAAFVPRRNMDRASLAVDASWAEDGVFVFMPAAPADRGVFVAALRTMLNSPINRTLRMMWLENPDDSFEQWRMNRLFAEKSGTAHTTARTSYIDIKNYSVSIPGGMQLAPGGPAASPVCVLSGQGGSRGFSLYTGFGSHRIDDEIEILTIPMAGPHLGCLVFDLSIKKDPADPQSGDAYGYPDLKMLDASIRLFTRDARFLSAPGEAAQLRSIRYPFFNESEQSSKASQYYPASIAFGVSIDPLQPTLHERTFFALKAPSGNLHSKTGIPTAFRTNLGRTVHMAPVSDADSRFVCAGLASTVSERGALAEALYLVPSGSFRLVVPRYRTDEAPDTAPLVNREENLICGLSGVEYIKLPANATSLVHFTPGSGAYLPGFVGASALLEDLPLIIEQERLGERIDEDLDTDRTLEDALGLNREELDQILERVRLDYFPPNHRFTNAELDAYRAVETIEEWTDWFEAAIGAISYPTGEDGVLDQAVTTSWAYATQSGTSNPVYYAQPDQAVLYRAPQQETTTSDRASAFLEFMEVPAVGLPGPTAFAASGGGNADASILAFPLLPYGQVSGDESTDCHALEVQLIAKFRRERIAEIGAAAGNTTPLVPVPAEGADTGGADHEGTTPQGLLATFSDDYRDWKKLLLARDTAGKDVTFTGIGHGQPIKSALQASQLFMVLDNQASVLDYFNSERPAADGTNKLEIRKWIFNMDPETWAKRKTIMIFKFHDKPLLDLARDPGFWSQAESLTKGAQTTRDNLVKLLEEAISLSQNPDPKIRRKYEDLARAAQYAGWSGILVLNVDVPLGTLPGELRGLAAGIDPDKFYAQYVGVSITPVKAVSGKLVAEQSSMFGLIDYNNDQPPPAPPPHSAGYNFHVRILTVVFKNSQIADFAAEIIVTLDKLFGETTKLFGNSNGRNTLVLKGTAEKHGDQTTYSFGFTGDNHFVTEESEVLEDVEIVKATFVTDPPGTSAEFDVQSRFFFWGRLNFRSLKGFDVLSFGAEPDPDSEKTSCLSFSNLQLLMQFDIPVFEEPSGADTRVFTFDPARLVFDFKQSKVRKQSLYAKFPLKLTQLQHSRGGVSALNALGYMPVSSPLTGGSVGEEWYAMKFDLVLGTLGALAGNANLTVGILAAWSPGDEHNGVFVGLKLPGATGGKKEINIQGVLKIVFKKIQFVVNHDEAANKTSYLLKLKNILLKFLVLSIPPNAQTEIIIFGDPEETGSEEKRSVGWYASYAKK